VDEMRIRILDRALARQARFRRALEAAYPFPAHMLDHLADDTVVCRCEGVTAGTIRKTIAERVPTEVNRLKAFTRNGMGRCQGRMCAHVGAELLARANGGDIAAAGRQRAQAPVKPLPLTAALNVEEPT
jgi:NAD(P)H-nitrite reductase large subunit